MSDAVCFVLKGYPRLSETFIAEEILALEQAGLDVRLVALRRPTDRTVHPVHRAIKAPVAYLPEYLHREPRRVLRALMALRGRPGLRQALRALLADLPRDLSRNRLRRFGQGAVLAAELPDGVGHLHAHFIHTPASTVRYAALICGLPFTCSAHAKDIWTSPDWDLSDKLREARWTVTCTAAGKARLDALSPPGKPVHLSYHGLRLDRFQPLALPRPPRDGHGPEPVHLLTVGRAVDKKGFDTLLDALALLPADMQWRLTHIGGGGLLGALRAQAERLGIASRVCFEGAQEQTAVLDRYREADLFVLPCRVSADGDRDGLPNVLVEAQSQGLPCISTDVGGVAELIEAGRNGLLVRPDDPERLAAALASLIGDPALRRRLGEAGRRRVAAHFDIRASTRALLGLFGRSAPVPAGAARDPALLP